MEERLRPSCSVLVPEEIKEVIKKWKISHTKLAEAIGMRVPTFNNKFNNNLNTGFSEDEYRDLIKALKEMIKDIEPVLNMYPQFEE